MGETVPLYSGTEHLVFLEEIAFGLVVCLGRDTLGFTGWLGSLLAGASGGGGDTGVGCGG